MSKAEPKTMNLKPSMEQSMSMLILLLTDGDYEGKKYAAGELLRIGRQIDAANEALTYLEK